MKIVFTNEPWYEDLPDGRHRRLLRDVVVLVDGRPILIPAGFVTDGASIPRGLWNLLPPFGKYTKAAILHDWLYQFGEFTRSQADFIFLEAMKTLGVALWKRQIMYAGVRVGARPAWARYEKQRIFMGENTQID